MKTPRAALLVAVLAIAPAAQASSPISLEGWTAYNALYVADAKLLYGGAPYADGVIYCDFRTAQSNLIPTYNCVVIGRAPTAPAKVGGRFASGKAYYQRSTGPVLTTPGGRSDSLLLKINQVPYIEKLVLLTTVIPAAQAPYTAYVEGGEHLNAAASPAGHASGPKKPHHHAGGPAYWCDPALGKITAVPPGHAAKGSHKVPHKDSACAVGSKPPAPPVVASGSLALIDGLEAKWLTKVQAAAYAEARKNAKDEPARKALDVKYRGLVETQIRPEAAAAYKTAYALPPAQAPAKIAEAIGKVETWGGEIKGIVAPFQKEKPDPKMLEVQLSKADWDALNKKEKADALKPYQASRIQADGSTGDGTVFDAKYLDPVAMHLGAEAARKALGTSAKPPVVEPKPGEDKPAALLTEDEQKKLLTPEERKNYLAILASAKGNAADASLQALIKTLRAKIAAEEREKHPYAPPTADNFKDWFKDKNTPAWHKDTFCDPKTAGGAVAASTEAKLDFDPKAGNLTDLQRIAAEKAAADKLAAAEAAKPLPDWARGECAAYMASRTSTPSGGNGGTGGGISGPVDSKYANNEEPKAKEKNKWVNWPLTQSAMQGGLVGLLIGSLFGPIGLIAGPLIGAAIYYGMSKHAADKPKE